MKRSSFSIAIDVDRFLSLSLSNYEFEVLAEIINDSEDPEETAVNIMNCGPRIAWYLIAISK